MTASLLNKEGRALAPATKEITVSVVQRGGRILLLRRREDKQFDPGRWEFVSGFVKGAGSLQEQARAQAAFETGLQPRLEKEGAAFEVHDEYGAWKIHPFLFSAGAGDVRIPKEDHTEFRWVRPDGLARFDCVKELERNLKSLGL